MKSNISLGRWRPLKPGFTVALLVSLTLLACNEDLPTAPETLAAVVVSLSNTSAKIPADGNSTIQILVSIDPQADTDKRTVRFKTSAGSFVEALGQTDNKMITKQADAQGKAAATLRSSTTPGVATVTVDVLQGTTSLTGTARTLDITFERADLVLISSSSSRLVADGVTLLTIEAKVPTPSSGMVAFSTTLGTFGSDASSTTRTTNAQPNAAGIARAQLKSLEIGTAIVSAEYQSQVAELEVECIRPDANEILVLEPDASSLSADTVSEVRIEARVQPGRTGSITFTSSRGTLSPSTPVAIGNDGMATVRLKSDQQVGRARVSGNLDGFEADTSVQFVRAFPSMLTVVLDKSDITVEAGATVAVTVNLARDSGKVSLATPVTLEAFGVNPGGETIPIEDVSFRNQGTSNAAEVVTASLDVALTAYEGLLTVRARVYREDGSIAAEDSEIVRLMKP